MERTKAMRALLDIDDDTDSEKSDSTSPQPEPRYLYYRLFTQNIRVPSKHPAFPNNSYIGRVKANSIAPPLTAFMIKLRLCKIENINNFSSSTLFLSESSQSPTDDGDRVDIITPGSSGTTLNKPIELVVELSYFEELELEKLNFNSMSPKPCYIYYNLYAEDGEISAKHPISSNADSHNLARIDINGVPPPHTVNSIIRCISYFEDFEFCFWHRLFLENTSELPYKAKDILTRGGPGFTYDRPLAFVKSAGMTRQFKPKLTSQRCGTRTIHYLQVNRISVSHRNGLLAMSASDTLYTDGIVRREALIQGGTKYDVYRARNDSKGGQHGFVLKDEVAPEY